MCIKKKVLWGPSVGLKTRCNPKNKSQTTGINSQSTYSVFEYCCNGDIPGGSHDLCRGNSAAIWLDDSSTGCSISNIPTRSPLNGVPSSAIAPSVTWLSATIAPVRPSSRNRSPSSFFFMVSSSSYGRRSSPKPECEVRATTEAMLPGGAARRRFSRARRWMMWSKTPNMPTVARIKERKCAGSSLGIQFLVRKGMCKKEMETHSTFSREPMETTVPVIFLFSLTK